jgi:hypothetical protein
MESMLPIAIINTQAVMRRSLNGARGDDPVVPERPRRWSRLRRRPAAQPPSATTRDAGAPVLKPRGIS